MNPENEKQPTICIDFKKNRIRIHKNALALIGNPSSVLLLVNPVERTLLLQATIANDNQGHHLSWAAARKKTCFEIYSQEFVSRLRSTCGNMSINRSYRMIGAVIENMAAIAFDLDAAACMEE